MMLAGSLLAVALSAPYGTAKTYMAQFLNGLIYFSRNGMMDPYDNLRNIPSRRQTEMDSIVRWSFCFLHRPLEPHPRPI